MLWLKYCIVVDSVKESNANSNLEQNIDNDHNTNNDSTSLISSIQPAADTKIPNTVNNSTSKRLVYFYIHIVLLKEANK